MSFIRFLSAYFKYDILIIFFLGLSSGLPLALILSTLKAFLVDGGVDLKTIGFFSVVSLPYSFKFLWAPFVDSLQIPYLTKKLGKRRSWIILSQFILMILIAMLGEYDAIKDTVTIAILAFSICFVSATQDIVVDAYRIEEIKPEDQGIATGMYVYGYRIGMLISGAVALFLSDKIAWNLVYLIVASVMLIGMLTTILAKEDLRRAKSKAHDFIGWFKDSVISPLADFIHRPKWYIIFPFIICFKLGDAFAGSMTLPFLLEIGFSKTQIAEIVKTFGLFATLSGVFIGGILVKSIGLNKSLWIAGILQMLSNLAFAYQATLGNYVPTLYGVVFIENLSGGIGDAVFVAYLSSLCNVAFTATQYAILVSFATMSRSILSTSTGIFAEFFGWQGFFLFSTLVAIPGLILLSVLTSKFLIKSK
jgi:PAT family beta-lactamase induction signal transducer AmpG